MDKFGWTILLTTEEAYHSYLNELESDVRCFLDETIVADCYFLAMDIHTEKIFGGFAITTNQELKGLFSLEKAKGANIFIRQMRIAKTFKTSNILKLNCIGEFLREFYESFGFEVYNVARWDERLAPKNWNTERFGVPNIYYMKKEL